MKSCPYCAEQIQETAQVCPHCKRAISGGQSGVPVASRGKPSGVAKVFWVVSIVCAVLGGIVGIGGVAAASGAPQEASAAAIGCLITIAPYVFARGIDELTRR